MKKLSFKKAVKFIAKNNIEKPIYYATREDWDNRSNNINFMFSIPYKDGMIYKSSKECIFDENFVLNLDDFKHKWIIKKYE